MVSQELDHERSLALHHGLLYHLISYSTGRTISYRVGTNMKLKFGSVQAPYHLVPLFVLRHTKIKSDKMVGGLFLYGCVKYCADSQHIELVRY